MAVKLRVDPDNCMGAQRCTFLAPSVFELNDEGQAEVADDSALSEKDARKLADECPNMAIEVIES